MQFCSLYSGSSGNSMFIGTDKTKILIDAGLTGKKLDEALKEISVCTNEINGIFITHEHSDHIKGAGVISRKYDIPIFANKETWEAMEQQLGKIKEYNIKVINKRDTTEIGDLYIKSFNIPHDAAGPMGYTVSDDRNHKVSIATDLGTFTQEVYENIKDSEIILLESNHDVNMLKFGPYPYNLKRRILSEIGHLSNEACGRAIVNIMKNGKTKNIILGHLSQTNNNPDLAYITVLDILRNNGIKEGYDVNLSMADRNKPSNYLTLKNNADLFSA